MATEKKTEDGVIQEKLEAIHQTKKTKEPRDKLKILRLVVPVALAFIFTLMAVYAVSNTTDSIKSHNYSGSEAATNVQEDFVLNEAGSDTVYQQQVTAQWAIKDMVKVVADQTEALSQMSQDLIKAQNTMLTVLGLMTGLLFIIVGLMASLGGRLIYLARKK
ncbi:hypothetical protein M2119_000605 [Aurantimicrobium minutum]|uniref:hypothetical protein n=1 Tax=Aurantimicrobium minutum TaxID=708131 RepID=UPI002475CEB0|nr:hypothetical protein [Aurantimicrobium minutum]MDH6532368.1 hypothetical protein [Aurantimicrobium minutum]